MDIGALRFLADRIQLVFKHISTDIIEGDLRLSSRQICLEPRGQSFARFFRRSIAESGLVSFAIGSRFPDIDTTPVIPVTIGLG